MAHVLWKPVLIAILLFSLVSIGRGDDTDLKNRDGSWKWTNHLIQETSPYLLLHAHNPVDWYPWGDEALARAKAENKLIFLSVGYATCHWCHVMEREVFSNPEIAATMNRNFINIKVDREERPDLDAIYMTATQLLIQRGGWPNSVFLTPDLKPFYAGTYFPPTDMPGRPGFPTILDAVHEAWVTRETEVIESANQISATIESATSTGFSALTAPPLDDSLTDTALEYLRRTYSRADGGFGDAPKFPTPANLAFLLSTYERTPDESLLEMVTRTLDMMAYGGIYDQIGGGFHRYAVDANWRIPHFEKMLYDNAQLAKVYLQAYHLTRKDRYRRIAEETFAFVLREMTSPEGGFYSALDAETDAEEGKYYVWTAAEIQEALGEERGSRLAEVYGVDQGANFSGKNVLYVPGGAAAEATLADIAPDREKLLTARQKREYPLLDTKIIVNWNGLMIEALAYGYQILGEDRYLRAAAKAARFILETLRKPNGELVHTYTAGEVKPDVYLDDYAFFVRGLLGIHQATGDATWVDPARTLTDRMIRLFWDAKNGGFYYTKADAKHLIVRTKNPYDSAVPSGNSVAIENLLTLQTGYREYARRTLNCFAASMAQSPSSFMSMHVALNRYLTSTQEREADPQPIAKIRIEATSREGSDVHAVKVRLTIQDDWHLNANPTSQENLIPTTLSVDPDAPVEIINAVYPKGTSKQLGFNAGKLDVYEGRFDIWVWLKRKPDAKQAGDIPVTLKLTYQACSDTECLLPETRELPLNIYPDL